MNAEELDEIVRKHGCWLRGEGGERAVLTGTILTGCNLTGTILTGAILRGCKLTGAILRGCNLTGANLTGCNLTGANLTGADLRGCNLTGAVLTGAVLTGAVLRGAVLTGADIRSGIPKIEKLHSKILSAIEAGGSLDMAAWHTCETTHCRAGWAIQIAGDFGRGMEWAIGSSAAGALLFAVAYPDQKIPDFYASNEEAMADIRRCAAEENGGGK